MKSNLKFLAIAAISATTLFSSCNNDDDNNNTPTPTAINSYSNLTLGAQTNSNGSYLGGTNGVVYSASQAAAAVTNVDISYAALGNSEEPTLLSWNFRDDPSTGLTATVPSGARNTYFKASTVTPTQFLQIANGDDANFKSFTVTSSDPQKIVVSANGVYQFLTQDGKKGLIHVQTITPGVSGSVVVNVKSEK